MKFSIAILWLTLGSVSSWALPESPNPAQGDYESSIAATVRNKIYFKRNSAELSAVVGLMPYDLVIDHFNVGGRAIWHFSDHFSWEVLDVQAFTSRFSGWTTDLLADSNNAIQRLDALRLRSLIATSFLLSPIYGKIRLFGQQVLYFDIYAVFGVGTGRVDTVSLSSSDRVGNVTATAWDPAFSLGLGLKLFLHRSMGIVIDFRDYMVSSQSYDRRSLKSNYTVTAGLSVFIPPL